MSGRRPPRRPGVGGSSVILALTLLLGLSALSLHIPRAAGEVVEITLYGRDFPTPGWSLTPGNETDPGPTLRVNLGDEVRLRLVAEDGLPHVFYIDYDGNGLPTLGLEPISPEFTTETTLIFGASQAGVFTYWCAVHQPDMSGGWITNGPPAVALTTPSPGLSWSGGTDHDVVFTLTDEDVAVNATLWLNFSHAGGTQTGSIAGPVAGTANPNVIPWSVPFIDAADVVLNVTGVDSLGARGVTLSAPFEVDSTPPSIEARLPSPDAQGVPLNARVEVRWSENMNETATGGPSAFGIRHDADGSWLAGSLMWDSGSETMTFTPASFLAPNTAYSIHVNASVKDDSDPGNALSGSVLWTFQTGAVADFEGPSIRDITAFPAVAGVGESVSLSATITDPSGVSAAWVVIAGPEVMLNSTLVPFGDRWVLNRTWEAPGTYEFEIWAQDGAGNFNMALGSFEIQPQAPGLQVSPFILIIAAIVGGVAALSTLYLILKRRSKPGQRR